MYVNKKPLVIDMTWWLKIINNWTKTIMYKSRKSCRGIASSIKTFTSHGGIMLIVVKTMTNKAVVTRIDLYGIKFLNNVEAINGFSSNA